ncbi:MAG: cobaltochelatase subunit CobN [Rhodospirillaceae bacterium TMED8]|nr:cobaltochelatase subunit CobN [Magnetovibrio sp.]OUT50454.1 MAG: cobaltochelatase subunit CobN [Rhodospirillaceae bacterium TMED8]
MHLLAAQPGAIDDGSEAVDLCQTPGDIIFISAADTELSMLADARAALPAKGFPSMRLANLMQLGHNMSVDLYIDGVITKAKIVIVRLLGGRGYWPYGVEQIVLACRRADVHLAFLPGDDEPDLELTELSTLPIESQHRLWQYCVHGGRENIADLLRYTADLIGIKTEWREPRPLMRAGLYWRGTASIDLDAIRKDWKPNQPVAALVFYRALMQADNLLAVQALVEGLADVGLNALPIFIASLKDEVSAAALDTFFAEESPDIILNATGFAYSPPGKPRVKGPFDIFDDGESGPPVLQVVFSGGNREGWSDNTRGLSARDIAMNVALPEVDGRVLTRAVSFKGVARRDQLSETNVVRYEPVSNRIAFVSKLAAAWAKLGRTPAAERRIALVLANYPNRDGRLGNGVGLDTPAGAVELLRAMKDVGYTIGEVPDDGDALVSRILLGPTNDFDKLADRKITETLSLADYNLFLGELPSGVHNAVIERWGEPKNDPFYQEVAGTCGRFAIPAFRIGNVTIGLQPARGYNINPKESYHDPDLAPPHSYLAFYAWLRNSFRAHALIHFGKHGNLEWLPGKALALSENCFPEIALGPLPNIYPFIVNDPGEGTQAKRRTSAVIVDHLTPPLTRAESYGPLKDLEQLVDEYFEAAGVDPRRLRVLARDILDLCHANGLGADCGINPKDEDAVALGKLDNYLCELKEMQIRDGLHIFGVAPEGRLLTDLLVALARVPRADGNAGDASLQRALAEDLGLEFDPLNCELAANWTGLKPDILALLNDDVCRTNGDMVERLEILAVKLVAKEIPVQSSWVNTIAVLEIIETRLRPAVENSGKAEIAGVITALSGKFLEPGPSGAPTRGRPDVLPTGRNFYSVDTRTVPTPAAWKLGWNSAGILVERHMQEHGVWPRTVALSAWGTSNMRTGGDDIAQGMALLGVKPTWDVASRRVTGFEVMPATVLGRPRVDVTLRISGFFRDAFPNLIDLFDSAARAVGALDEPSEINPAACSNRRENLALQKSGLSPADAQRRSGYRVFGSMPSAYGAGLQALIDESVWETDEDLARAYIAWGGYAYGAGSEGQPEHDLFETRLKTVEAVIHNQDNREHDLLDSDDYYQFEGGMTAAVRQLSGTQPAAYHMDHSCPETPRARTLEEEVARVVRARVINPKWIRGVMRHGYKGAFEMAATVDYLFAFAATAHCVADHHFDAVFDAYLANNAVREFLEINNPSALQEMVARFKEAQSRGLWRPRRNDTINALRTMERASETIKSDDKG